jgi:hypothetical protein
VIRWKEVKEGQENRRYEYGRCSALVTIRLRHMMAQIKLSEAVSNLPPEVSFLDALICMYLRALVSDITSRLYFLFFKRPISYP